MAGPWETIVNFFTGKGYTREQAQGIAGNIAGESNYDPNAIGDGGKAYGLAQWHPDRQSIFQRIFGKSITQSTFLEQLQFIDYELKNNESKAGNMLRNATSVEEATKIFMQYYERPANMSSLPKRVAAAMGNDKGAGKSMYSLPDSWSLEDIGRWLQEGMGLNPDKKWEALEQSTGIPNIFNSEFAGRLTSVVIGVILVGLAIAAFVFLSETKVVQQAVS